MKLFLLSREGHIDYDQFLGGVVCAMDEADARTIHPGGEPYKDSDHWVAPEDIVVKEIGIAAPDMARGAVLGSLNAG